jgi:hypothetical protein
VLSVRWVEQSETHHAGDDGFRQAQPILPLSLRLVRSCADHLDESQDVAPKPRGRDAVERHDPALTLPGAKEAYEGIGHDLSSAVESARCTVIKRLYRHAKSLADLLQTAGADAVGALFVFLKLLERHPDRGGEIGLAHVEREAPHPDTAAYVLVDGIRTSDGHGNHSTTRTCGAIY